jgi:hypothetical protein
MLGHTPSSQALVLQLASLITRFAPGSTGSMDDAHPSFPLVLVLPTFAPCPESLHIAVGQSNGEHQLPVSHGSHHTQLC